MTVLLAFQDFVIDVLFFCEFKRSHHETEAEFKWKIGFEIEFRFLLVDTFVNA